MATSVSHHTGRPDIIAWELTGTVDRPVGDQSPRADDIIEQCAGFGPDQRVVLTGLDGAPRQDVKTIAEQAREFGLELVVAPHDPRTIDRTLLRSLASEAIAGISLPMDGPDRSTHDELYGDIGRFDATIRVARWAAEHGVPIEVRSTVAADTIDGIEHLAARTMALDADRWTLSFTVSTTDGIAPSGVVPDDAERLLRWLAGIDSTAELEVVTAQAPMYRRIAKQAEGASDRPRETTLVAGDTMVYIGPDGVVSPSGSLPIELGRLPDDNLVDIYQSHPLVQSLRDRTDRTGKCGVCEFNEICGGSRSRAFANFGDPLAQDPMCPFIPAIVSEDS